MKSQRLLFSGKYKKTGAPQRRSSSHVFTLQAGSSQFVIVDVIPLGKIEILLKNCHNFLFHNVKLPFCPRVFHFLRTATVIHPRKADVLPKQNKKWSNLAKRRGLLGLPFSAERCISFIKDSIYQKGESHESIQSYASHRPL